MFELNDIFPIYQKVIVEWEKTIQQMNYICRVINETERIYEIEDCFVLYLGMVDYALKTDGNVYKVVFEELLENNILPFNFSAFLKTFSLEERNSIEYKRFHGIWGEPIRKADEFRTAYSNRLFDTAQTAEDYLVDSRAEYIDKTFPQLFLKQRYQDWKGVRYFLIVYELREGNRVGYAVAHTKNPLVHKIAIQKANDVEGEAVQFYALRIQNNMDKSIIGTENDRLKMLVESGKYAMKVRCDWNMLDILCNKIEIHKSNHWEHKNSKKGIGLKWCIAEQDLKYFVVEKYLKGETLRDIIDAEIETLSEAVKGKYENEVRSEYLIPSNRWKSEQLVYEYTKKLFKDRIVQYQHKPFHLRKNGGKMSYDVFICGLNIAIEYQGKQHFEPVEIFGGETHFQRQVERDKLKMKLSKENGITLIYINYWEDISPKLIKEKIDAALQI